MNLKKVAKRWAPILVLLGAGAYALSQEQLQAGLEALREATRGMKTTEHSIQPERYPVSPLQDGILETFNSLDGERAGQ